MGFSDMKDSLLEALERNTQIIRRRRETGQLEAKLRIPVLSGPSGIGKTAAVRAVAEEKGYSIIELDCSFMPANHLVAQLQNVIGGIERAEETGAIVLLDNINEADEEWQVILIQYAGNFIDTKVTLAEVDADGKPVRPARHRAYPVKWPALPEQIFIVGEQRPE